MTAFQRLIAVCVTLAILWIVAMVILPFVVDGVFYSIETPVPVHGVTEDSLFLHFTRWARFPMNGVCSRELACNYTIELGESPCPLEAGWNTAIFLYPLPEGISGECVLRGHIRYRPFGNFGPELTATWESEPFRRPTNGDS